MKHRISSICTGVVSYLNVCLSPAKLLSHLFKCTICMVFLSGYATVMLVSTRVLAEWSVPAALSASPVKIPEGLLDLLQAGDVIFRIGNDWTSDIVRGTQNDEKDPYSHVGILTGDGSQWQVLHAVPAEVPGRMDAVVLDDLEFFLAPDRARGFAVYRVAAERSAHEAAIKYAMARLGAPFRIVKNDSEGQYCTTLVWHAWKHAGIDLSVNFDHLNIPLASGQYLLPYSLRRAPELSLLFEVRTE